MRRALLVVCEALLELTKWCYACSYAVEDVDYDSSNPTPEGGKYNTTLKSIVPLPDKNDPHKTYPDHDYAAGTQVMALYPDTTSFYRAIIQSGPIPLITGTEKGKVSSQSHLCAQEMDS